MNILTSNYKLFNGDCLEVMDYLIEMGKEGQMIYIIYRY